MGTTTGRDPAGEAGRGRALLVLSAVAFSTAGLFTRGAAVDFVALVFWRNVFGAAALLPLVFLLTPGGPRRALAGLGPGAWAAVAGWTVATLCFLGALRLTSVAHVAVIYAGAPLAAAAVAWLCLGERPPRRTVLASVVALAGAALTVAGPASGGTAAGDALAALMTLALAGVTVLVGRQPRRPVLLLAGLSTAAPALLILPLVIGAPARFALGPFEALWLAGFGVMTMAVALPCYIAGAARLPAAQAMLLSALEMPLAPLWVWLACTEAAPAPATLAGGALVALAIGWDLRWGRGDGEGKDKGLRKVRSISQK